MKVIFLPPWLRAALTHSGSGKGYDVLLDPQTLGCILSTEDVANYVRCQTMSWHLLVDTLIGFGENLSISDYVGWPSNCATGGLYGLGMYGNGLGEGEYEEPTLNKLAFQIEHVHRDYLVIGIAHDTTRTMSTRFPALAQFRRELLEVVHDRIGLASLAALPAFASYCRYLKSSANPAT